MAKLRRRGGKKSFGPNGERLYGGKVDRRIEDRKTRKYMSEPVQGFGPAPKRKVTRKKKRVSRRR